MGAMNISNPQLLRYTIVDQEYYNRIVFDTKTKPQPIHDVGGGFEHLSEQWLIAMLEKGVIRLRDDSFVPDESTAKADVDQIRITDFPSLYEVIIDVEKKAGIPIFFYVHIDDTVLSFTSNEFVPIHKWKEKLVGLDMVLSVRGKGVHESFDDFITVLVRDARTVWVDNESEDDIYSSIILEEINKQIITKDKNSFMAGSNSCLIENGVRIVKSATISNIINYLNLPITLTKAREVLRPFLSRSSNQIKISGKQISVWHFKDKIDESDNLINTDDKEGNIDKGH